MLNNWLNQYVAHFADWGLLDKQRAEFLLIASILLSIYAFLGYIYCWMFVPIFSFMASSFFLCLVIAVAILPFVVLRLTASIKHLAFWILAGHFLLYSLVISMSGMSESPLMINLLYLPLIGLLSGNFRLALMWFFISAVLITMLIVIDSLTGGMHARLALNERGYWYQANLVFCIIVSGLLAAAYEKIIREVSDILSDERKRLLEESMIDDLTGLYNKSMLYKTLEVIAFKNNELNQRVGLVFLDIDAFVKVNTVYGHHTGDQVLRLLASRLKSSMRSNDILCRFEADRFVLVLPSIQDVENLHQLLDKLQKLIEAPIITSKHEIALSYNIDSCIYDGEESPEQLISSMFGTIDDRTEPYLREYI